MDSEDEVSTFSADEMMDSSEDETVNNNMFVSIENIYNKNCDGIGPNTCDNRVACVWTCNTRHGSDRDRGCCKSRRSPSRSRPSRPTRRPSPRPTRRPTGSSSGGSSFNDGLDAGRRAAERIWRDAGNRCSSAWGDFQNRVNRRVRSEGWDRSNNWRTRSFNEGARKGMNEIVVQKEKECFRDSSDECVDLGDEAARIIAYDHCPGRMRVNNKERRRWRRDCRNAAVDQCRSSVRNEVRNQCGSSPSTRDLTTLRNKCRNQVLTMVGDRSEEE